MYIFVLIILTGFIETCFIDKGVPIAEITETGTEEGESHRRRNSSAIYNLSSDILLCICSPHLDIAQSFDFTEKVCILS
jgi:hypothetical protein